MEDIPEEIIDSFLEACHDIARRGLVRCGSGNMSFRLDDKRMLVTSAGSWMERLTRDQVSICNIADAGLLRGLPPTTEAGFHAGTLRARPDAAVVLHFQSLFATILACRQNGPPNPFVIPEAPFYVGEPVWIPYYTPGSDDLARAVIEALRDHDMAFISNHGQVTVGCDFDRVVQNAVFFELACEIIIRGGDGLKRIGEEQIEQLLKRRAGKRI